MFPLTVVGGFSNGSSRRHPVGLNQEPDALAKVCLSLIMASHVCLSYVCWWSVCSYSGALALGNACRQPFRLRTCWPHRAESSCLFQYNIGRCGHNYGYTFPPPFTVACRAASPFGYAKLGASRRNRAVSVAMTCKR